MKTGPLSPSSAVRVAVVGTGAIAQTHLTALAGVPQARLTAISGRDEAKTKALSTRYGVRAVTSVKELAAAGDVDAVLIATASGAHADSAVPLLLAGKHVLCEKPLEVTAVRAREMIASAQKTGKTLAAFFPMRTGAAAMEIKRALDENRFGRRTFLSARVKWWRDEAYYSSSTWRGQWRWDGGGALMNQGIHAVDLLHWFGGRPTSVTAFAATLAHPHIEVEDTLAATLKFEDGALGTIAAGTACYPGLDLTIEVCGDRGTAVMENDRIAVWKFADETAHDKRVRSNKTSGAVAGGTSDPKAISCEGHRRQIEDFCRFLLGEAVNPVLGEDALVAVQIVEAMYRSARSGRAEGL